MFPRSQAKISNSLVTIASLHSQSLEDLNLVFYLLPTLVFEGVEDGMVSSSIFTSSRLPISALDKRLQIGTCTTYDTEDTADGCRFIPTIHDAYICIAGGKVMNQIALTYGSNNLKMRVASTSVVRFDEPFSSLDGDMTSESAMKKLRALGCSLFLAAGHLDGFKEYPDFFLSLRKACAWIKNNGRPPIMPPRLPLGKIQQNVRRVGKDNTRFEEEDENPQDDDEFIKIQTYESPATPLLSSSQSMLGSMKQVRLTSLGIDVIGGSSHEPRRQKIGSKIRLGSTSRMKPLQFHHKQTHEEFTTLRNENAALKEMNSTFLATNEEMKTQAALAESQNEELESMKSDMEVLREHLRTETEARRVEADARLSETEKRKEAEAKLESLIQQQIDLASSYRRND